MNKSPRSRKKAQTTLRSTSGAGFEFEDLIAAWQLVKALSGEQAPGVGGVGTQLQAQVSTLGWRIDDLLLTGEANGVSRRLAISAKGNQQVSASGLPSDFVTRAWEEWRDAQRPFNGAADGLALVTLGPNQEFSETWREVKSACNGTDATLAMSRIRSNRRQSRVFDSVQKPSGISTATDGETIELIRRLHVLPTDLQFAYSETKNQSIAQCRRLLASGDAGEAEALWNGLVNVATDLRLRKGTITVRDLWSVLRVQFELRHHPDFERDWETLYNITADHKARIETEFPSGYAVPRAAQYASLRTALTENQITVVFGESGCGKSALVRSVLDVEFPSWNQVWLYPEELKTALSAARRSSLPLRHELSRVLDATVNPTNVLVMDSAERIEPSEFVVIRQLLQTVVPTAEQATGSAWRVVVVTQTQGWVESEETILGERKARFVELEQISRNAVKLALLSTPTLGWLTGHDDTVAALTNLRTLVWVIKAGAALSSSASALVSHTAIADRLWKYWTGDRADVQALVMRLAEREASFERSFALTDLAPADTATFTQRPRELPLRLDERSNRVVFEHDLAADWARFQFLKQIGTDTEQWTVLAENPLWTNALRMLGQFLLRQSAEDGPTWDAAFQEAQATNNELAGNILLDALCLDPDAERFLAERVELLLENDTKIFTRLLLRFHHIATMPAGGSKSLNSAIGLHMEAKFRSIVFGRWPPVLRFLIAQRERLAGLVSSALATVIETWLTKTPRALDNGLLMPFRRELAEIVLAMARTVQVEKGHGVTYLPRDCVLYTAPLAAAADLPEEVGNWALELAGRRKVDTEVMRRIVEVRRQQAQDHAERLKTDADYKARHDQRRRIPPSIGSFRERLPPWPLGARAKVDMDFRTACMKENGLQPLMRAQPDVAAEVLLALIVEDQPERDRGSGRYDVSLGLDFPRDAYPTAFWKSPFFSFLQIAPDAALDALIALVNFCTERWFTEGAQGRKARSLGLTLRLEDGSENTFPGWWQVFGWPQSNDSMRNGNLYCALDALERWLTLRLDAGEDISADIGKLLRQGDSAALVGVLVNVAKYRPSLLKEKLAPLLTFPNLFYWDSVRVGQVGYNFIGWSWLQAGRTMFDVARDWTLAPHRRRKFLEVVVELLKVDDDVARRLQALISSWSLPEDPKEALEFKLIYATLNRDNYHNDTDPGTGAEVWGMVFPEELRLEILSWQTEKTKPLEYLLLPDRCEHRLESGQPLTEKEAGYLYDALQTEAENDVDESDWSNFRLAASAALIVLGRECLDKMPGAQDQALGVLRAAVSEISSTGDEIRRRRIASFRDGLVFAARAVTHLWIRGDDAQEWEADVLRLLTSGDARVLAAVVAVAYAHREQLGLAWWRLLQAGVLWSGLVLLAPQHGDDTAAERAWSIWLARLRRFPLRNMDATPDDLNFGRVAAGWARLEFDREVRLLASGERTWRGKPDRRPGVLLDGHVLAAAFGWLLDGTGTGDRLLDTRLSLRIWDYDAARAKAHGKSDRYGEYDLPSQNLGYDVLSKLAALSMAAPDHEQQMVWGPVLAHGPAAHYALQHFIRGLYSRLRKGGDADAFERLWRSVAEYGLAANWSKPGLWFYGERLICDLLGFGNEDALALLAPGAALRMKDVYQRWASTHLNSDEECITRFSFFLTTGFGAPLRPDGLRWIAAMLETKTSSNHWYREGTGDALVELVAAALSSDAQALSKDADARKALVEIAAALAAKNTPTALALQDRIKLLR